MDFQQLCRRAADIRTQYQQYEVAQYGRSWTDQEVALGLVGDVGDLMKLIQAKHGVRNISNKDERLAHELADCLWSIMTLADLYDIDLEQAFVKTMDELELHLSKIDGEAE